ncbi:MAG: alpha/beta fold hydrolase [Gammaproteobacteria bacterium]
MPVCREEVPDRHVTEREHRLRLADGRTIAYLDLGDAGGSPIFYFHGYPGSRLEARLAAGAAQGHGLRMLAPDRPGFGQSTFLPGRTIGAWAADVAELADRLELARFAIVGVSGGGPYALACAARIPERVSRVGLVGSPGPLALKPLTHEMIALNRLALGLIAHSPFLVQLAIELAAPWIRRHPEHHVAHMMGTAPPADRRVLAEPHYHALVIESLVEALRQGGRGAASELTLLARPWDFGLQEVRMPVRIWQGLADNIVPAANARHLAAMLPASECHYLPDEGHLSLGARHFDAILADLRT